MFLTHWPVMTFSHSAKPAGFLSRQQTTLNHQDSQQRSGAFTNVCVPYHPESDSLQGPSKDLMLVTTRTAAKEKTAVQCAITSNIHESDVKKTLSILQIHIFSCLVDMLKYLQNWETIHCVFSSDSITDVEEC